jgi:sporulation protein YunB
MFMRKKNKWKKGKKSAWQKTRRLFFVFGFLVLLTTIYTWLYIEKHLKPAIMHHAQITIMQMASKAINSAITEQIAGDQSFSKLVDWRTDANGKVSGFTLNYMEHMRITSTTVKLVQQTLNQLGQQNAKIPIGLAFNSSLLTNYGPSVPVKFQPAGDVKVDLNVRQKNAGINMLLVEVFIRVTVDMSVFIPFDAKLQTVKTELPITYMLVVGDVPNYMVTPNATNK